MYDIIQASIPSSLLSRKGRKGSDKVQMLLDTIARLSVGTGFYVNAIIDEEFTKTERRVHNAVYKMRKEHGERNFDVCVFRETKDVEALRAVFDSDYTKRCEAAKAEAKANKTEYMVPTHRVQGIGFAIFRKADSKK